MNSKRGVNKIDIFFERLSVIKDTKKSMFSQIQQLMDDAISKYNKKIVQEYPNISEQILNSWWEEISEIKSKTITKKKNIKKKKKKIIKKKIIKKKKKKIINKIDVGDVGDVGDNNVEKTKCGWLFTRGTKKGQMCLNKLKNDRYCVKHYKQKLITKSSSDEVKIAVVDEKYDNICETMKGFCSYIYKHGKYTDTMCNKLIDDDNNDIMLCNKHNIHNKNKRDDDEDDDEDKFSRYNKQIENILEI